MNTKRNPLPKIVAIVGGSCAGKTWLVEKLGERLAGEAVRLSLDDYYLDKSHLSPARREKTNFDHPRAIDWVKVEETLLNLARGEPATVPIYDFATHSRLTEVRKVSPREIVLFEGLWLLRKASLRKLYSYSIFIQCPTKISKERRFSRDVSERGREREFVEHQFNNMVLPMQEKFVSPQVRWADQVLAEPPGEVEVAAIARKLQELISTKN